MKSVAMFTVAGSQHSWPPSSVVTASRRTHASTTSAPTQQLPSTERWSDTGSQSLELMPAR